MLYSEGFTGHGQYFRVHKFNSVFLFHFSFIESGVVREIFHTSYVAADARLMRGGRGGQTTTKKAVTLKKTLAHLTPFNPLCLDVEKTVLLLYINL